MDVRSPQALHPAPELEDIQAILEMDPLDYDLLKQDIKKNGIRQAIIIYEHNDTDYIIAGFHRWKIALELKLDTVPVEFFEGGREARRQYAIIENLSRRHITKDQKILLCRHLPPRVSAAILKQTERQSKYDKAIAKQAEQIAGEQGRDVPTVQDVKEAKRRKTAEKKPKTTKQMNSEIISPPRRETRPPAGEFPQVIEAPGADHAVLQRITEYAAYLNDRAGGLKRQADNEGKTHKAGQLLGEARACANISKKLLELLSKNT